MESKKKRIIVNKRPYLYAVLLIVSNFVYAQTRLSPYSFNRENPILNNYNQIFKNHTEFFYLVISENGNGYGVAYNDSINKYEYTEFSFPIDMLAKDSINIKSYIDVNKTCILADSITDKLSSLLRAAVISSSFAYEDLSTDKPAIFYFMHQNRIVSCDRYVKSSNCGKLIKLSEILCQGVKTGVTSNIINKSDSLAALTASFYSLCNEDVISAEINHNFFNSPTYDRHHWNFHNRITKERDFQISLIIAFAGIVLCFVLIYIRIHGKKITFIFFVVFVLRSMIVSATDNKSITILRGYYCTQYLKSEKINQLNQLLNARMGIPFSHAIDFYTNQFFIPAERLNTLLLEKESQQNDTIYIIPQNDEYNILAKMDIDCNEPEKTQLLLDYATGNSPYYTLDKDNEHLYKLIYIECYAIERPVSFFDSMWGNLFFASYKDFCKSTKIVYIITGIQKYNIMFVEDKIFHIWMPEEENVIFKVTKIND